jgi:magnesium-transporting ATPase (P-type)
MAPKAKENVADVDVEYKGSGAADDDDVYWHSMSKEDACGILGLGKNIRQDGLSTEQAKTRLEKYGPNQLTEKEKVTLLQRIWQQVNNVLVGILVFVAVVSLIKGSISSGQDRLTNFIEVGLITFVIT